MCEALVSREMITWSHSLLLIESRSESNYLGALRGRGEVDDP